jgi:LPXTG-site transpeptidase (sortase) family protein
LRNAWLGTAVSSQRMHRRYGVPFALILCGGALALGAPSIIQLNDNHVARARMQETDAWARRYEATSPPSVTATSARNTVVAPDRDGYLLVIPKIGLRVIVRTLEPDVFSGKNTPTLRRYGLGQVPYTRDLRNGSPGAEGTAVIAGHRTTSGAPLRHINLLRPGDIIIIRKMGVEQQWVVEGSVIVPPSAVGVIKSRPGTRKLAILACNPPFSAKERLVVSARLKQETVEWRAQATRADDRFKGGW